MVRIGSQYWMTDRLWLSGSAGVGRLRVTERISLCPSEQPLCFDTTSVERERSNGVALAASVGADLYQRTSFGIELQAGVYALRTSGANLHGGVMSLGVHWY